MADADDLSRVIDAVRTITLAEELRRHALAAAVGLPNTDVTALVHLRREGELGQGELAARLAITTGSTTTLVDRLVDHGFAVRKAHPTDRRRAIIALTPSGAACVAEADDLLLAALRLLPPDTLAALAASVARLAVAVLRAQQTLTGPRSEP